MHWDDAAYLALSTFAGAAGRALRRGLPAAWRSRLEARPPAGLEPGWIWLHAVSMGEVLLAEGLAAELGGRRLRVHVTTGTQAGLEVLGRKLEAWNAKGGRFSGGPFPLDDRRGLAPFLELPPALFVALETELWPGLLRALRQRDIPALVVNGRLTSRSLERGGPWLRRAASRLSLVLARDPDSVEAFQRLGAPRVALGGNLKADLPPPPPLHAGWAVLASAWQGDPVLVAGNTVEGEEALLLDACSRRRQPFRLILAPRQPRRFAEVARLLAARGLAFRQASEPWPEAPGDWAGIRVLLLDTLGELASAYQLGRAALVGGGWTWSGGHNPLEPARWGIPVGIGPGFDNFTDLVQPLQAAGLVEVVEAGDLERWIELRLGAAPGRGTALQRLPPGLQGALEKTWAGIQEFLPPPR